MKIQTEIENKIQKNLQPLHIEVANESHRHRNLPNAETHFKLVVVSPHFQGQALVDRHRQVYELLQAEMKSGVHALALHLFTPEEWVKRTEAAKSPLCQGRSKSE